MKNLSAGVDESLLTLGRKRPEKVILEAISRASAVTKPAVCRSFDAFPGRCGILQGVVRAAVLAAVLVLPLLGCGGSDATDAGAAAQAYVHALGRHDGKGVCAHMTQALQKRFTSAVTFANPGLTGDCARLMQAAIDSVPAEQLAQFSAASIRNVKVKGASGTFTYTLKAAKVDGRVAKEGGSWKVSCCVPGQDG